MVNNAQNILFLYLNTGNGHKSIADMVKSGLEASPNFNKDERKVFLEHGFDPRHPLVTTFYEGGYRFTSSVLPGAYSLFYDINCNKKLLNITKHFTVWGNTRHLKNLIIKYQITKIVSFHFAVSPIAESVIRSDFPGIKLINVVTDPYTAHPSWFLTKKAGYIFFSKQLADFYVPRYKIKNYSIQPFPINPKFEKKANSSLRKTNSNTFNVLVAGGGEGLRGAVHIIETFVHKNDNLKLTVVCGRNKKLKKMIEFIKLTNPKFDVTILGFVNNMDTLMAKSDCIISKCGASTVHEILASGKPYIISQYIHGQELGNMRYVKDTGCGWFLQKPEKIYKKVIELQNNPQYYAKICQNIDNLSIHSDLKGISNYILNY